MATLSATLSRPAAADRKPLIIEQEGYGPADGYLSRAGMYRGLLALLSGTQPDAPVCVDECATAFYVYRRDLALEYRLQVSHGDLGLRVRQDDLFYTQKISFVMESEADLAYPCWGVVESRWLGDVVYDRDGGITTPPVLTTSSNLLTLSKQVYGTLAITYRINRDRYDLELPRRAAAIENSYSSVAYATWTGGIEWLPVQPPPGAEESGQQCFGGGGGSLTIVPDDEPGLPVADNADAEIVIDYCTQEVISDSTK